MQKKYISSLGKFSGKVLGGTLGGGIKLAGKAVRSSYIEEVGDSVGRTTNFTCRTVGDLGQGAVDTVSGVVRRDKEEINEGLSEIGATTWGATKAVGKGLAYTVNSSFDVAAGLASKDSERTKEGLKNLGKVAAVSTIAIGLVDVVDGTGEAAEPVDIQSMNTINAELAGSTHPVSGIPYEVQTVETPDGNYVQGVFPIFDSMYDATIPPEHYESSDYTHARLANDQLAQAVEMDPSLQSQFSSMQLEQIQDGETPDGYTWHHHEEMGKIQLVETEPHDQSGHTGGRSIWGGGSENR
ncbi:HNH endonuclease [Bacillus alkalisoli]|uniref:HNH endonuclease n=1 Tax=Bacillus alkalisoli TaxID=2011008 RepID=UPI000C24FC3E|nr:HNH endonuclease [Bacillus alkalisoli]